MDNKLKKHRFIRSNQFNSLDIWICRDCGLLRENIYGEFIYDPFGDELKEEPECEKSK